MENKESVFNTFAEIKEMRHKRLVKNWEESGLLEGLVGMRNKDIAKLFESKPHCFIENLEEE
jgi:hypothetical protein